MLGAQRHPLVILLQVCQDNITVFHDCRYFSLPIAILTAEEAPAGVAQRLANTLGAFTDAELSYVVSRAMWSCGGLTFLLFTGCHS
jgi:hypothetical protein